MKKAFPLLLIVMGLVFLGAVAYFVIARSRGEREDVAALRGTPAEDVEDTAAEPAEEADVAEDKDDAEKKNSTESVNSPETVKPE